MTEDQERQQAFERAREVKDAHAQELLSKRHVVGVGVGLRQRGGEYTDTVALIVMVDSKLPTDELDPDDVIPSEIEGVPVDVQEVGQIRAQ